MTRQVKQEMKEWERERERKKERRRYPRRASQQRTYSVLKITLFLTGIEPRATALTTPLRHQSCPKNDQVLKTYKIKLFGTSQILIFRKIQRVLGLLGSGRTFPPKMFRVRLGLELVEGLRGRVERSKESCSKPHR